MLHGMQTQSSDEKAVRPSVCQSKAWIVDKMEERSVQIFIPYKQCGAYNNESALTQEQTE